MGDLELEVLAGAMAAGDPFLLEVARRALLSMLTDVPPSRTARTFSATVSPTRRPCAGFMTWLSRQSSGKREHYSGRFQPQRRLFDA